MPLSKPGVESLRFVSVTDPAQNKDVAQRGAIRKHVMRRFWGQIKGQGQTSLQPVQADAGHSDPSLACASETYLTFRKCSCQELRLVGNESVLGPRHISESAAPIGLEN